MKVSNIEVTYLGGFGDDLTCKGCGEEKLPSEFPRRADNSGRIRPYCYVCAQDAQRARYKSHKETQPFLHKCTRAQSRSQHLKVPFDLTAEYLESIWTGLCPILQKPIYLHERARTDEYAAELDRFIPDKGYVQGNVHFLSRRMNRLKNNVTSKELATLLRWMESHENSAH